MKRCCDCGCGAEIMMSKRFVSGHNSKGSITKLRVSAGPCSQCSSDLVMTEKDRARRSKGKTIFCNKICRDLFRKSQTGTQHPDYRRVERTCLECKTVFSAIPSGAVYCSRECGQKGRVKKIIGINFRKGHIGTSIGSTRELCRQRDNFACRVCGFREALHVHHVIHKKEGGGDQVSNLITLCPNHHALAHMNLLLPKELFEIIKRPIPQQELKLVRPDHALAYRRNKSA